MPWLGRLRNLWHPNSPKKYMDTGQAKVPIIIQTVMDYRPPQAMTDCVAVQSMPRLTSGGMKQGMVMKLMRSLLGDHKLSFIGNGNSAVVYDASACEPEVFDRLFHMLTAPLVKSLRIQGYVVIKFSIIGGMSAYEDAIRENTVHRYLSSNQTLIQRTPLTIDSCVPAFFFSGYLSGWYVTVMQNMRFPYISLQQHLADGPLVVADYIMLERMLYQMWSISVVHADVHLRNIVFNPKTHHFVLLDFGNAMFLPPTYTKRVKRSLASRDDAVTVWFTHLSVYVRSVVGSRNLAGFQPDGYLLRSLKADTVV